MSIVAWFRVSSDGSPWVDQRRKHPWNTYARCHVRPRHSSRLAFLPLHSLRWWKRGQLIGVPVPDRSCQGLVGAPHPLQCSWRRSFAWTSDTSCRWGWNSKRSSWLCNPSRPSQIIAGLDLNGFGTFGDCVSQEFPSYKKLLSRSPHSSPHKQRISI